MSNELKLQRNYWNKQANDFQKIYSKEKSKFLSTLDKYFRKDMFERFVYTIENCEPIKGRTFLDVGSGNGLFSIELAKKGAKKVIGIDIAENMINLSDENATKESVADLCSFHQSDLMDYKPETEIDVSFGIGLFDYIKDSLPVLKKMKRVSKDKAIMSFPRFWTWRAPIRKIRLMVRKCDVYFYTKSRIISLLKESGFKNVRIDKVGKLFCVIAYTH